MAARVHVTDTYDVPDTHDADADTDDDAGPCEDIVVLAKTHSGASEDTYCGSATLTMYLYISYIYLYVLNYIKYIKIHARKRPDRSGRSPEGQNGPKLALYTFL